MGGVITRMVQECPAANQRNAGLDFNGQNQVVGVAMLNLSKRAPQLHPQALGSTTEAQIFSDADEVSKVPKFHKLLPHRSQTKWRAPTLKQIRNPKSEARNPKRRDQPIVEC